MARAGAWSSTCGLVVAAAPPDPEGSPMDLVSLGLVVAFFALSWGFVKLCDRL
jgi:hypothetical protein